jgi:hypothetical protein
MMHLHQYLMEEEAESTVHPQHHLCIHVFVTEERGEGGVALRRARSMARRVAGTFSQHNNKLYKNT